MIGIDIKALISQHRKVCVALAVFLVAVLLGFSDGRQEMQNTDQVRVKDLMGEMRRVLRILEPVLKPTAVAANKKQENGVAQGLGGMIARGVISSLPDGSWNEDSTVTRGEGLFYFGRMLLALKDDLVQSPMILDIEPTLEDIVSEHWLREFLPGLAGIGALEQFKSGCLIPDMIMKTKELRSIGSAFIDYFGSNLLIMNFDGKVARLYPKGAIHKLKVEEWNYSFNRRDWYQIGKDGLIEPDFTTGKAGSIFFRNSSYREAGPMLIKANNPSIGMIKLQRNYADFANKRLLAQNSDSKNDSDEERERIRTRLSQIKERNQHKHSNDLWMRENTDKVVRVAKPEQAQIIPDPVVTISRTDKALADEGLDEMSKDSMLTTYQGRVVDALNGEPLKGAVIITATKQYTADKDGFFSFAAIPRTVVDLTAYTENYEALKIRHRAGYRNGPLILSLKPVFASCHGTVTNLNNGNPVGKALVKIGNRATRTSADGCFALKGVRPGFHQISVFARDFMEAHEIAHISAEPDQEINMQLRQVFSDDAVFADNYQGL
ncbi:MAG: hypothetical protein KKB51_22665 [Candidatus Riflebacteria bacterium]|nr:hypothetical protein [Candidatus Riflebacteria bacterium]